MKATSELSRSVDSVSMTITVDATVGQFRVIADCLKKGQWHRCGDGFGSLLSSLLDQQLGKIDMTASIQDG